MVRFFPSPSGKYPVGYTDVINEYGKGRLLFRLYYPATKDNQENLKKDAWLEERKYAAGLASFFGLPRLAFLVNWLVSDLRVFAQRDAPPFKSDDKLPVAVFSHGLGGNRFIYSTSCVELASHGIVVASVEHSDQSASATFYLEDKEGKEGGGKKHWIDYLAGVNKLPNEFEVRNNQVSHRARECSETLTYLEKINLGQISAVGCTNSNLLGHWRNMLDVDDCPAIIGHSFGGATMVATLAEDKRFKAGVGMDVWTFPLSNEMYRKLQLNPAPILFINTETFHWPSNIANLRKMDTDTCTAGRPDRITVTVLGTVHQSQSDAPYFVDQEWLGKSVRLRGTLAPNAATQLNNRLLIAFLSKHLPRMAPHQDVSDVVTSCKDSLMFGSNVEIDEARVMASKTKLAANTANL